MRAPRKPTPAQLYAAALLGMTEDGRLVLWDTGRVLPVSQFQIDGTSRVGAGSMMGTSLSTGSDRRWSRISATS